MGSFLIINGQRYGYPGDKSLSTEEIGHPIGYTSIRDPNWVDGPWKLRYRLFDMAREHEHWLSMPELKELTHRDENWVASQVRIGKMDAGMVRGSSIPLFRILDRAGIIRETVLERPVVLPEHNRKKSDRWDK
jgi:hypothetical protein